MQRGGDTVQVMKPSFSHEISTEIKVKDKTTGNRLRQPQAGVG